LAIFLVFLGLEAAFLVPFAAFGFWALGFWALGFLAADFLADDPFPPLLFAGLAGV
jgi:hypothetical protein